MKTFVMRTALMWVVLASLVLVAGCKVEMDPAVRNDAGVTLAWDANTEANLAGYKLHIGLESGTYLQSIDVGNVTEYAVENLQEGTTYYFAVRAYCSEGTESAPSGELSYTVPVSAVSVSVARTE